PLWRWASPACPPPACTSVTPCGPRLATSSSASRASSSISSTRTGRSYAVGAAAAPPPALIEQVGELCALLVVEHRVDVAQRLDHRGARFAGRTDKQREIGRAHV